MHIPHTDRPQVQSRENSSLIFSLETSAKATSQHCAREVTKAFSVVSNRVGIRERSVFWASRGAGRKRQVSA